MSWDNFDDDFLEFAKFSTANQNEHMFDDKELVMVIYVHIQSADLVEFVNRWNKTQYKIRVKMIHTLFDDELSKTEYWLAGGKRLFGALKSYVQLAIFNLKILRVGKGFDTQYAISEYERTRQHILDEKIS